MDVRIDYTFGVFQADGVSYERNYRPDADLAAQIAAVSIAKEADARARDFTVCEDVTVVASPGQIVRSITLALTADFISRFPTEDQQRSSLTNYFRRLLEMRTPYIKTAFESFTFGALCP